MDVSNNTTYDVSNNQMSKLEAYKKMIENRNEKLKQEAIGIVCRQTTYDENTAKEKLELHRYNVIPVLNEYNGVTEKKEPSIKSNNQVIYSEIRNLMDGCSRNFRKQQERAEYLKKMQNK
jgi:hypothetical protein